MEKVISIIADNNHNFLCNLLIATLSMVIVDVSAILTLLGLCLSADMPVPICIRVLRVLPYFTLGQHADWPIQRVCLQLKSREEACCKDLQ